MLRAAEKVVSKKLKFGPIFTSSENTIIRFYLAYDQHVPIQSDIVIKRIKFGLEVKDDVLQTQFNTVQILQLCECWATSVVSFATCGVVVSCECGECECRCHTLGPGRSCSAQTRAASAPAGHQATAAGTAVQTAGHLLARPARPQATAGL